MDNDVFNATHIFSSLFIQSGIIDHNSHGHIMAGSNPWLSTLQEDPMNNFHVANHRETPISRTMFHAGNSSVEGSYGNADLREPLTGTSLPATSPANLLSATQGLQENLFSVNISSTSALSPDMRAFMPRDSYNSLSSSDPTPENYGNGLQAINTVCPSYHIMGSSQPGWNANNSTPKSGHLDSYFVPRNGLSLSLGSCQPSIIDLPDIPDQCSEISCSGITQATPKDGRFPSTNEQHFHNSEELSLYCGPSIPFHFSHILLGSRYRYVAQQILAEVASYALENLDELESLGVESERRMSSSSCSNAVGFSVVGSDEFSPSSEEISAQANLSHSLGGQESRSEKIKLLSMLQMIDHGYNQCLDQIQNVISSFHNATSSGSPQIHAQFALHTVTAIYKTLRERITNQLLLAGQQRSRECMRGKEKAFESSFIQKQWALQQMRNDQQSWRPQRGLPERSVSVLRAWMFQNFLHPYPKDTEKHLLAVRSGLTRSQVSNWFINARVRLWKPMIEEMYNEFIKKHQNKEGFQGDCRSRGNNSNQRIQ